MSTFLIPAAEATAVGNPTLNIGIFLGFVVFTLGIVIKVAGGKKTAEQYYTSAGAFSGRQNGIAIAGDYLSAASFLGIAGAIALSGLDGFLYSIGFLVAWLVALLLVAELMRNIGRFTMADVLSYRLKQRPVRIATSVSVMCVSLFYLLAHASKEACAASFKAFRDDPDWLKVREASEKAAGGSLTVKDGVQSVLLAPTDYSPTR